MSAQSLNALSKKLEAIFKDKSKTRRQYNRQYGQVFILDTKMVEALIVELLQGGELKDSKAKPAAKAILRKMKNLLAKESTYGSKKYGMIRAKEYVERIQKGEVPGISLKSGQIAYAVRNYNTVNEIKSTIGKLISRYTKRYGKEVAASGFTGSDNKSGIQLGHGELSAAVSTIKTLKVEQALARFGSNSKELIDGINEIKRKYNESHGLNIYLKHEQVLTSRGSFKKGYTAIFSSQATLENMMDAKDERKFLTEINNYISENIVNLKGSPSLLEATTSTLLNNFATKKNLKVNTKTQSKSKSVSESKRKSKLKQSTPSVSRGSVVGKKNRQANTKVGVAGSPLALIQAFNSRLPRVIMENMKSPALVNRTGTFANSVKVVDAVQTPQGFASFGYTYDKYPYQTFEPGFAQGSVDRDPRKLIDRSMREIAAEFAIGRFYTRRL